MILGDELAGGHVLRDLEAATQRPVELADLPEYFERETGKSNISTERPYGPDAERPPFSRGC